MKLDTPEVYRLEGYGRDLFTVRRWTMSFEFDNGMEADNDEPRGEEFENQWWRYLCRTVRTGDLVWDWYETHREMLTFETREDAEFFIESWTFGKDSVRVEYE